MNGAGRSRWSLRLALIGGMAVGAAVLSGLLFLLHETLRWLEGAAPVALAVSLVVVFGLEISGLIGRLAGNWRVPAHWVTDEGVRTGLVWGTALGSGLVTEAPYGVLHAALIVAAVSPATWPVIAVPALFALGRLLVTLHPGTRQAVIDRMDVMVNVAGRSLPTSMLVARLSSRAVLLVAAVVAVAGAISA